jgi:hypothetical protein
MILEINLLKRSYLNKKLKIEIVEYNTKGIYQIKFCLVNICQGMILERELIFWKNFH